MVGLLVDSSYVLNITWSMLMLFSLREIARVDSKAEAERRALMWEKMRIRGAWEVVVLDANHSAARVTDMLLWAESRYQVWESGCVGSGRDWKRPGQEKVCRAVERSEMVSWMSLVVVR